MGPMFRDSFKNPGGHSNNSVIHMRDQRNMKKGLFLRLNAIRGNRIYGLKMRPFLRKRVLLDSIGVIVQNHPKKACLGVNLEAKSCEILV